MTNNFFERWSFASMRYWILLWQIYATTCISSVVGLHSTPFESRICHTRMQERYLPEGSYSTWVLTCLYIQLASNVDLALILVLTEASGWIQELIRALTGIHTSPCGSLTHTRSLAADHWCRAGEKGKNRWVWVQRWLLKCRMLL